MGYFKNLAFIIVTSITVLNGCSSATTFNNYARGGDTVAVVIGWNPDYQFKDIQVTITDFNNFPTVYTAPDDFGTGTSGIPKPIRGSVNFYPDPVSSLVLSERLQTDVTQAALTYANNINSEATDVGADDTTAFGGGNADGEWDRDWWQTVVFVDLPAGMAIGDANITITDKNNPATEYASSTVTIIPGAGGYNRFSALLGVWDIELADAQFTAMGRADHHVVEFTGSTVPDAIQIDLTHNADSAHDGTGTPYVINPTGTIKSISWSQTGTNGTDLRVVIMPTKDGEIANMRDFKFYIAGGVENVAVNGSVQAFDNDGETVTGVSASVTAMN